MDPIRCVMLISTAGRVRKAESLQGNSAEALFLDFAGSSNLHQRGSFGAKEKAFQLSWNALVVRLLLFVCFGWRLSRLVIGAHNVIKSLLLGRGQKSPDSGMGRPLSRLQFG